MAQDSKTDTRHGIFQEFFHSEVSGSIVLLACTVLALAWANSPWAASYFEIQHAKIGLSFGEAKFALSLQHWINDGLMVIFFFVVGLEIKRELVAGELSSMRNAALPVAAAIGGMLIPALVFTSFNLGGAGASGWGIPMATDIAFALGILALFGSRAPLGLKVFLTALAIADDLGAVMVIAIFYTDSIEWVGLIAAAVLMGLLLLARWSGTRKVGIYLVLAVGVWLAVLASGVHATIAGILVALIVPVHGRIEPSKFLERARACLDELGESGLTKTSMIADRKQLGAIEELYEATDDLRPPGLSLEHSLHPIQAFLILPLFALFNAGVAIDEGIVGTLLTPVSLGTAAGLVAGKLVGISFMTWVVVKFGLGSLPEGSSWGAIFGVACLAGVGFTMSLFVTDLAFDDETLIRQAKVGILAGSLLAGVMGYLLLSRSLPKAAPGPG